MNASKLGKEGFNFDFIIIIRKDNSFIKFHLIYSLHVKYIFCIYFVFSISTEKIEKCYKKQNNSNNLTHSIQLFFFIYITQTHNNTTLIVSHKDI